MTKDDIIELAVKAGLIRVGDGWTEPHRWGISELEAFAKLVAEATSPQRKPHKMPIPPGQAPITDTCYAEGWNACCDAFFNGLPPPEPLIITVTQEVPAQRKPLTEEEIKKAVLDDPVGSAVLLGLMRDEVMVTQLRQAINLIARAVEQAHGIGEKP